MLTHHLAYVHQNLLKVLQTSHFEAGGHFRTIHVVKENGFYPIALPLQCKNATSK